MYQSLMHTEFAAASRIDHRAPRDPRTPRRITIRAAFARYLRPRAVGAPTAAGWRYRATTGAAEAPAASPRA